MDEQNKENPIMHEAEIFSKVSTKDSENEPELTTEEREKFEKLMNDIIKEGVSFYDFRQTYDEFVRDFNT